MEKIKEFEKAVIEAVAALRNELGATRIELSIHVDDYEKCCKTDLSYFTSIPKEVPGCGSACKGN